MASKVKKGFLYYLAWFAFICLGIVCIFASILVFNPGKDVFGINLCYISHNIEKEYKTLNIDGQTKKLKELNLENIVITTKSSNISIVSDHYIDQLTIKVVSNITGFTTKANYEEYNVSITHNNNTLNVNIKESKLSLAFNNNAVVKIICPPSFNLSNSNLTINTNSGNFTMGTEEQFPSILKSLTVNSKNNKVKLMEHSSFTSGNVTLNAEKLNAFIKCDIPGILNIKSNSGDLSLDSINGDLNLISNSIEANCGIIRGDIFYSCDDGFININTIGSNTQDGSFTSSQETEISNVTIKKIYGNIAIPNGNMSDIIVNDIDGEALIETTAGNVTIGKSNDNISITTTSGSVKFTQTNVNAITAINTSSGKITGNFSEVGQANILSKKGKVIVNVATDKPFKLVYETNKSIDISFIEKELEKSGSLLIAIEEDNGKIMEIITENTIIINNGFTLD